MRLIITCGCGDTTQFAKDAFRILYPNESIPEVVELNETTKPLIKILLLALFPQKEVDNFLDSKFAISIDVRYEMQFDIMAGEATEGAAISVVNLIKGEELELC